MQKRVFIEDVGRLIRKIGGEIFVWEIEDLFRDSKNPPLIYLVESKAGARFLLERGSFGRKKFELIQAIAQTLFYCLPEKVLGEGPWRQFLIFRGAYPFDLQRPSKRILKYQLLPTTFLKLQRVLAPDNSTWIVQESFCLGEFNGKIWFIPDTAIASGSTVEYLLRKGFQQYLPQKVIVFTAAGSLQGIQRIWKICKEHKVELVPIFSQCIFEVSEKGVLPNLPFTDLPIENEKTITSRRFYKIAHRVYQGKRMCAVGDVGDSLENPIKYLLDTLKEIALLEIDPTKEGWEWVGQWFKKLWFRKKLKTEDPLTYSYLNGFWR